MTTIAFQSEFADRGGIDTFTQDQIKREPMLFSASADFAVEFGGEITRHILGRLPEDWLSEWDSLIVDSRVHMLMPGWYPCIPGWHLDDVPRSGIGGQPDHVTPRYRSEHLLVNVGDCCPTCFLVGDLELEDTDPGSLGLEVCPETSIYGKWHRDIETLLPDGSSQLRTALIEECRLIQFGWGGFHRGTAARANGWRFFLRASRHSERKFMNETRAQVQVYLPWPNTGE